MITLLQLTLHHARKVDAAVLALEKGVLWEWVNGVDYSSVETSRSLRV
jgi:hypothetical protein